MIHLKSSQTSKALCNSISGILTSEQPPNRYVKSLYQICKQLYDDNLQKETIKRQEKLNNRSAREKFRDWLWCLAHLGESDMEAILYPMTIIGTLGLIVPAKYLAKLLLKTGI